MHSNGDDFLKKTLGEDFIEVLAKVELWKPGTRTTIDHEEIKTALKIVPRTVLALLIRELTPMKIGDSKEIDIPAGDGAKLKVNKHERDVYTGVVEQENKVIVDFKYRSIPGIGLVIMSALELYSVDELSEPVSKDLAPAQDITEKVQHLIEERLALHSLINQVVDKKLAQKDAIQQLLLAQITQRLEQDKKAKDIAELAKLSKITAPMSDPYFRGMANGIAVADAVVNDKEAEFVEKNESKSKKVSPLGNFLESRKNKKPKKEFSIELSKGEHVNCQDCGGNIFNGEVFSGCVCVGEDMEKKVYLKKTEEGIKVRFSQGWDQENIEMLLEMLRRRNG